MRYVWCSSCLGSELFHYVSDLYLFDWANCHAFACFVADGRSTCSTVGALLTFIIDSQWAACSAGSHSPCWASLSVSACLSQLVEISEVIRVLTERLPLAVGSFFQHEDSSDHRESSRSFSLSLWCSGWSRSPLNSCCEAEKSNLVDGMCGVGEKGER